MPEITRKTTLGEVARDFPEAVEVLAKYGLHCVGCPMSLMETVEQGGLAHGLNEKEIDKMIEEANKAIKKKEEK